MQLVYEVILLSKILRNHLLSENMQWNYASFNVTLNYLMHEIIEFWVTSSSALANWEQKYCETLGDKPNHSHRLLRRENLNYLMVCFTQCTLFFQKVCFLLQICLPCVICGTSGTYVTKINVVLWHSARQTFPSLGLFTLARIACLLQLWIKTSHLGDAQITSNSHH